jgi:ribonuclease D
VVPRQPKTHDTTLIEDQGQIEELCSQARRRGRFAFDTEFVMEDRFAPELCLVQVATDESVAVIDPFNDLDLGPVFGLISDPGIETIVHAGQEDLSICVHRTGTAPRCVYDVQIAAGLAGYEYPLSLQKLIRTTAHVRLHKSKTLTDWRRRPLTQAQIRYAADDVAYLLAARDRIGQRLAARKREGWADEEFQRFEDMSLYRRAEEEKLSRVKGSGSLEGRQLAILREVLAWREGVAEKLNRPMRALLKDHLAVEIAKHGLATFKEVRDLRGINLSDRHVRALCDVVVQAAALPESAWPAAAPRDTETPDETALIALATGVVRSVCAEHDLAYGLVATKRSIHQLVRHCLGTGEAGANSTELLRGWRAEAVGTLAQDVLLGKRAIRVKPARGSAVIRVSRVAVKGEPADSPRGERVTKRPRKDPD